MRSSGLWSWFLDSKLESEDDCLTALAMVAQRMGKRWIMQNLHKV